jgi:uncharacterized OsmC-like protein
MPNLKFSVKSKSENPTKTVVEARSFKMIIDEPANLGGTDHGANPVEYILGALTGCLNVVGHMIANEMGFNLRGLEFNVEGDLDPAKFQGKPESGRAGFMEIRVTVIPHTDANQTILQEWIKKVEERCPVSDNLANPTPVKVALGV